MSIIEWPEKLGNHYPKTYMDVVIRIPESTNNNNNNNTQEISQQLEGEVESETREVTLTAVGERWVHRLRLLVEELQRAQTSHDSDDNE